jgi:rhodanese-related sulfurtransferase
MNKYLVFFVVLFEMFFANAKAQSQEFSTVFQASVEEFQFWIDSCSNELIIDVREMNVFRGEYILNSMQAPDKATLMAICDTLDFDTPILIYCSNGERSLEAGTILLEKGFKKVLNLRLGFNAWKKANKKRN